MYRLVLDRPPAIAAASDPDAWARAIALVAAWPVGEPVWPAIERRLWRANRRGELRESVIVRLHDDLGMLDAAAVDAELTELARPLRAGVALRPASRRAVDALDGASYVHLGEVARLDSVIPEGRDALHGLFCELVAGVRAVEGPVALSMLVSPSATSPDASPDDAPLVRRVDFRLRLAAEQPLPVALRARAESVTAARAPHMHSWDLAAGRRETAVLNAALAEQRPGEQPGVPADPRTAALTLSLAAPRPAATALVGRPVEGQLARDGAVMGRVPRPSGAMARWRLGWDAREHHVLLTGASGSGKTTALERIVLDDLEAGRGLILIDPHGDLASALEPVLGGNPGTSFVDAANPDSRPLDLLHPDPRVAASIVSGAVDEVWPKDFAGPVFQRNVSQALRLMHHADVPLTFGRLERFFTDPAFRATLLETAEGGELHKSSKMLLHALDQPSQTDSSLSDWVAAKFTPLTQGPAQHLFDRPAMTTWERSVARGETTVVRLTSGVLGDGGTRLLGRMLLTRLTRALIAQEAAPVEQRTRVSVVIDEAHLVAGPALGALFAQVRKFGGSVTVATQVPAQLEPHLDTVLANTQTILTGRLTERSAAVFADRAGLDTVRMLPRLPRRHLALVTEDHDPSTVAPVLAPVGLPDRAAAARAVADRVATMVEDDGIRTPADVDTTARRALRPPHEEPRGASFIDEWLERRRSQGVGSH